MPGPVAPGAYDPQIHEYFHGVGAYATALDPPVVEASGGIEALDILERGLRPDVVITDYKMPRIDGAALAAEIQRRYPSIAILVITGYTGTTEDVLHLPRLAKPFGQAEIASLLASLVEHDDKVVPLPVTR